MPALNSATSSRPIGLVGDGQSEALAGPVAELARVPLALTLSDARRQRRQPVGRPAAVMGHGPFSAALLAAR